jgi:hypothetical protein
MYVLYFEKQQDLRYSKNEPITGPSINNTTAPWFSEVNFKCGHLFIGKN